MESKLRPRLCYLVKEERDYGFHLQGGRKIGGEFIRKVVPGSSADLGGLRPGDRVVEVNGVNVEKDSHHEVVKRVRAIPNRVRLLVVDSDTDEYLRSRGLVCTEDMAIEMGTLLSRPSSRPMPATSSLVRKISPLSVKPDHLHSFHSTAEDLSIDMIIQDKVKRSSLTSCSATDIELQVEPSPEPTDELCPRLCHLVKEDNGYGFSLHSNKTKGGQFVHSVDPGSAAESADIRPGDRILEVNGVNIEGLTHSEVVALIKSGREEVRLLVVDQEMDELFHRLKSTSITNHAKEAYMDESATESIKSTLCSTPELPTTNPQIINVTVTDAPITYMSQKSRANGSSASHSSRSSTTQSDISNSDISIQVFDEDDRRVSDPFVDSGLVLSSTAAEAKQKVRASRNKKRAPLMEWSKKRELFSSF
uniref:Na(+)/H(+) exchange regulatory cofactor NHE-RF2 n=1 Tax=Monopterus albus TaxID=43700 RepID=UPI0009B3971E|nr:Na(+)/H(+) exchange regulatory cofactor NHE-RF2-like [Monopterus albus]